MTFLVTAGETGGEETVVRFVNQPDDIGPPPHFHPEQEETFRVVDGTLALRVGRREMTLGAGDSHVVGRGVPHTFWNPGRSPVSFVSTHRPALGWEAFITTLYDLDYDGKAGETGLPSALQMFTILKSRLGEEYIEGPPLVVQRILARFLGTLGELRGYSATYVSDRRLNGVSSEKLR